MRFLILFLVLISVGVNTADDNLGIKNEESDNEFYESQVVFGHQNEIQETSDHKLPAKEIEIQDENLEESEVKKESNKVKSKFNLEKLVYESEKFVSFKLKEFRHNARRDQRLDTYYQDLLKYLLKIKNNTNQWTRNFKNIVNDLNKMKDKEEKTRDSFVSKTLVKKVVQLKPITIKIEFKLEVANKWIHKRFTHLRNPHDTNLLDNIEKEIIDLENMISLIHQVIISDGKMLDQMTREKDLEERKSDEIIKRIDWFIENKDFVSLGIDHVIEETLDLITSHIEMIQERNKENNNRDKKIREMMLKRRESFLEKLFTRNTSNKEIQVFNENNEEQKPSLKINHFNNFISLMKQKHRYQSLNLINKLRNKINTKKLKLKRLLKTNKKLTNISNKLRIKSSDTTAFKERIMALVSRLRVI